MFYFGSRSGFEPLWKREGPGTVCHVIKRIECSLRSRVLLNGQALVACCVMCLVTLTVPSILGSSGTITQILEGIGKEMPGLGGRSGRGALLVSFAAVFGICQVRKILFILFCFKMLASIPSLVVDSC